MEIPYTVRPRPDTGLANPKLGIWLFLASEVMLFGGLFAGYIFMRLSAEPWMWPHGWLNVPVGTFNTFILIFSSVTVILAWESLKMHNYKAYKIWLALTWICGLGFLGVKLGYEWPDKFGHFGSYVKLEALHKYEPFLGNEDPKDKDGNPVKDAKGEKILGRINRGESDRRFIGGHLEEAEKGSTQTSMELASIPYIAPEKLEGMISAVWSIRDKIKELEIEVAKPAPTLDDKLSGPALDSALHSRDILKKQLEVTKRTEQSMVSLLPKYGFTEKDVTELLDKEAPAAKQKELREEFLAKVNLVHIHLVDAVNAHPYDADNDKAHFVPRDKVDVATLTLNPSDARLLDHEKHLVLNKADLLEHQGALLPKLNTYLAAYFMITGLHGLHVLGGCIVFIYFWLPIKGGSKLYHTNHAQLCNRIEVAGLFWHLVDLIWIFVFPLFYLL